MTYQRIDDTEGRDRPALVTTKEVIEETLINVERLEAEVARVKRRLSELLELTVGTDL